MILIHFITLDSIKKKLLILLLVQKKMQNQYRNMDDNIKGKELFLLHTRGHIKKPFGTNSAKKTIDTENLIQIEIDLIFENLRDSTSLVLTELFYLFNMPRIGESFIRNFASAVLFCIVTL